MSTPHDLVHARLEARRRRRLRLRLARRRQELEQLPADPRGRVQSEMRPLRG